MISMLCLSVSAQTANAKCQYFGCILCLYFNLCYSVDFRGS